ncbi:GNAT family N-acetyltransferase [Acidaminobacter sp. JC074]|uniref:GNAT family N-acetyltransferase n=1 Tax=Acidaminobacter sp. JC074 TaxID=2530199 RepID=UPI001F108F11|nr:GNAT family N-acetyltransferase [Acidaminobacter sp. JC074]MCH4886885.1 GNAT family N-acetyltransferase [Acidaminobacter sp. JC074]
MIRKATIDDLSYIKSFVSRDYARNYFIALGLEKGYSTFKDIYMGDEAILFHRASGNLQFANYREDDGGFKDLIKTLDFKYLIGSKTMCHVLGLDIDHEGAYISELKKDDFVYEDTSASIIGLDDLEDIEGLYKKVFSGYPKVSYMKDKLISNRGTGYKIVKEKICSVAQSDFKRLIVGVATDPACQRMGYARACMMALMKTMFETEDSVYLQYDDKGAGKLYESLGFKRIDQVIHYKR